MATNVIPSAEFTLPDQYKTNRRSPNLWVLSHALRQWPGGLILLFGSIGNAVTASFTPILIGQAFNYLLSTPVNTQGIVQSAILIVITRLIRSILQLSRNLGRRM